MEFEISFIKLRSNVSRNSIDEALMTLNKLFAFKNILLRPTTY